MIQMKKSLTLLLVAALLSVSLFAQGAREMEVGEKPVKVIEIMETAAGTADILVADQNGNEIIYHTSADTAFSVPATLIQSGDVIAVKDNGMQTMSIPAQMFATSVRYITPVYAGSFPEIEAPYSLASAAESANTLWDVVVEEDMFSLFSYSYGYLSLENFKSQGLILKGAFFAKGILDYAEGVAPQIEIADMDAIIEDYITNVYAPGIIHDNGPSYGSIDLVRALEVPADILEDRFSYSYGYMIAASLSYNGIDVVPQPFVEGALTSIFSLDPLYSEEEMNDNINAYADYLNEQWEAMYEELKAQNLEMANSFLADNAKREGVITLPSGVQYEVITAGDGAKPTAEDTIIVNYTLSLLDGSIVDQGSAVEFPLTSLIPGFVDAACEMQVGEAITAYIPPALGYGENGSNSIEPNSLLIFDIELLEIVK
jgi:FKBP-type peptidyl-prolyl cis-trans isomerases 1